MHSGSKTIFLLNDRKYLNEISQVGNFEYVHFWIECQKRNTLDLAYKWQQKIGLF